ncbi:uncharacterized protein LOC126183566 [Schistocerca cancellata]|uniref:uncharacterized protein LOC126183566 n=1 Tax=Schistocerca cancellata TaxID=274614 RepID=UPI0021189A30|nr:uncharacterized protein LOC126183566 [Schistocerca cancellata]
MLLFKETFASLAVLVVLVAAVAAEPDEGANLFLKASRSVPHVGRRSDFFLKTAKSVPRIGRRSDLFLKSAKSVPRIGRRTNLPAIEAQDGSEWLWPGGADAMPSAVRRQAYYVRKDGQPVMWSDVARDVEENPDLWPWNDFDAGNTREVDNSR